MNNYIRTVGLSLFALFGIAQAQSAEPTTVNHPEWSRNAVIYEVNTRQYTPEGTFDAFATHLPRLRDLGVDILWFMPIHPISELNRKGGLGSYYAVRDYKGVNPEFGDMQSFRALVSKAHDLGMKVIIDWVPNHTGCDNAWVKQHPEWFAKNDKGKMYGPFDWTDVYQLDYNNKEMRAAMIDAMKFWITDACIDGFRCDVAGRVPVDFWNECRQALEAAKGEGQLFMLAEATEPELLEHGFDMDYNWPMKDLQNAVAATHGEYTFVREGQTEPATLPVRNAADIAALVTEQFAKYPAGSYMMNMVTNHDLNSWEGTEYQRYGKYLPAMTALTYMLPGMPLIYTGQEAALNRALEFFVKDNVTEFADIAKTGSQAWQANDMLKTLNAFKHAYPQLNAGMCNFTNAGSNEPWASSVTADNGSVVKIVRTVPGNSLAVVAIINFGTDNTPLPAYADKAIANAVNSQTVTVIGQSADKSDVAPGSAAILVVPVTALR